MDEPADVLKTAPGWARVMRGIFFAGLWLFVLGILVQSILAGRGMFGAGTFQAHIDLGWPLAHMIGPILLLISFFTRVGWKLHILSALAFVLAAIVPILATLRADAPDIAALHPFSAILTMVILLYVGWEMRLLVLGPKATPLDTVVGGPRTD